MATWTKPYCGVQHLNELTGGIRQITLTNYGPLESGGDLVEVWALGPQGFTPIWEDKASTVAEAQAKGEAYARSRGCLK